MLSGVEQSQEKREEERFRLLVLEKMSTDSPWTHAHSFFPYGEVPISFDAPPNHASIIMWLDIWWCTLRECGKVESTWRHQIHKKPRDFLGAMALEFSAVSWSRPEVAEHIREQSNRSLSSILRREKTESANNVG